MIAFSYHRSVMRFHSPHGSRGKTHDIGPVHEDGKGSGDSGS
jgi:hypothetical protein